MTFLIKLLSSLESVSLAASWSRDRCSQPTDCKSNQRNSDRNTDRNSSQILERWSNETTIPNPAFSKMAPPSSWKSMTTRIANSSWQSIKGQICTNHLLSEDKELAFTWSDDAPKVQMCDGSHASSLIKASHQARQHRGHQRQKTNQATISRNKPFFDPCKLDKIAGQLQALELRLEAFFQESFKQVFVIICRRIEELQAIDMILANAAPTLLARKLFNDSNIMGRLSGTILEIWPCIVIDSFSFIPMPSRCTEWIPH